MRWKVRDISLHRTINVTNCAKGFLENNNYPSYALYWTALHDRYHSLTGDGFDREFVDAIVSCGK